jgi:ribosomal RNA-processing protein 9
MASSSGSTLYTAGKDGTIVRTDLFTGRHVSSFYKIKPKATSKGKGKERAVEVPGHTDEILALALSDDGTLLATAGRDRKVETCDFGEK